MYNLKPHRGPQLVTQNVRTFFTNVLHQTHFAKRQSLNVFFNCMFCIFLFSGVALFLHYRYINRSSTADVEKKKAQVRALFLSKIDEYRHARMIAEKQLLSELPISDHQVAYQPYDQTSQVLNDMVQGSSAKHAILPMDFYSRIAELSNK